MLVKLSKKQAKLLASFCSILELREEEDSNHKKINVNYHSLAKHSGMSYNGVKKSTKLIKERLCS